MWRHTWNDLEFVRIISIINTLNLKLHQPCIDSLKWFTVSQMIVELSSPLTHRIEHIGFFAAKEIVFNVRQLYMAPSSVCLLSQMSSTSFTPTWWTPLHRATYAIFLVNHFNVSHWCVSLLVVVGKKIFGYVNLNWMKKKLKTNFPTISYIAFD